MSIDSKFGYDGAVIDAANNRKLNKSIQELIDAEPVTFDIDNCKALYESLKAAMGVILETQYVLSRTSKRYIETMVSRLDTMREYVNDLVTCDDQLAMYIKRRADLSELIDTSKCYWLISDLEIDVDLEYKISNLQARINLTRIRFIKELRLYICGYDD